MDDIEALQGSWGEKNFIITFSPNIQMTIYPLTNAESMDLYSGHQNFLY